MKENILDRILDNKRREVEAMADAMPMDCCVVPWRRMSMKKALTDSPSGIIAEFKRRSPSKGEIHPLAMAYHVVPGYERAGAAACSVLTDTVFFGGSTADLALAARSSGLPLLRKDFIVSRYQIAEACLHGANAVLLIAAALSRESIEKLTREAHRHHLEVLLELHSMAELDKFCPDVDMVGVNNRDLTTFRTDPMLSLKMAPELPDTVVKVAESGLSSMEEVRRLRDAGYRGFLIGETFMKHSDPALALENFLKG